MYGGVDCFLRGVRDEIGVGSCVCCVALVGEFMLL